jgi:hypothetical protein
MTLNVDLSLAVNYLPACACLGKTLALMLAVAAVPPGEEVDCFISLASMLYIDRLVTRNMIFDANAILLALYFANVHAHIRAVSPHRAYPGLVDGMFLFWALGSAVLIGEPRAVKQALDSRTRASKLVPVALMLLIITAIAHFHAPLETGTVRGGRAVAFTLLSFAWIYIVGIHTTHGIEYLKENSCQFVARLAPVLYASLWVAVGFAMAAIAGLAVQYMRLTSRAQTLLQQVQAIGPPPSAAEPEMSIHILDLQSKQTGELNTPKAEELDQDSELFRLARMQSLSGRSGSRPQALETIRETA